MHPTLRACLARDGADRLSWAARVALVSFALTGCSSGTASPPPIAPPPAPGGLAAWVELPELPALPFTYDGTDAALSPSQRALGERYLASITERAEDAPVVRFERLPQHWLPALTWVHVHGSTDGGHRELRSLTIGFDAHGRGRIVATVADVDEPGDVETIRGLRLCSDDGRTVCEDATPQLLEVLRADFSSREAAVAEIVRVMLPIAGAAAEGRLVRSAVDLPTGALRWWVDPVPPPAPPTFQAFAGGPHAEGLVVAPQTLGDDRVYAFELDGFDRLALSLRLVGQRIVHVE